MSVPYSALVNLGNRCELIPYLARLQGSMSCIKTQSPIPKAKRTQENQPFFRQSRNQCSLKYSYGVRRLARSPYGGARKAMLSLTAIVFAEHPTPSLRNRSEFS
jgi:hypothetical protein